MAISFQNALGVHQYALAARSARAEVLAENIANANTPNYKAQDIDFQRALQMASSNSQLGLNRTDIQHYVGGRFSSLGERKYRVPNQPDTGDGNTVDTQIERSLFMQNTLAYQATLDFLGSKFKNMTKAIKGE